MQWRWPHSPLWDPWREGRPRNIWFRSTAFAAAVRSTLSHRFQGFFTGHFGLSFGGWVGILSKSQQGVASERIFCLLQVAKPGTLWYSQKVAVVKQWSLPVAVGPARRGK